jgi:putative FmdB family regulatory protein
MPIYEYHCDDCDNSFEALVRPGRPEDAACPQCHGAHLSREMSVFSSSAGASGYSAAASDFTPNRGGGGCCGGGCGCH